MSVRELLPRLERLPYSHVLAFGASICERLVPSYRAFWLANRWGNPAVLEQALELLWRQSVVGIPAVEQVRDRIAECELIAPDADEFGTIYTYQAIGAVGVIWSLLKFSLNQELLHVKAVAETGRETMRYYVMVVNWPSIRPLKPDELEQVQAWIETAPLVRAEITQQLRDLDTLEATPVLDENFITAFRKAASEVGIHPIRRGLIAELNIGKPDVEADR